MKLQKFRWSKVYESTEEELVDFLRARNIASEHWVAEPFDASEVRTADQNITLWCAEGSLTLRVSGSTMSLQPGDAVPVSAGTPFSTDAGMSGCICYETTGMRGPSLDK